MVRSARDDHPADIGSTSADRPRWSIRAVVVAADRVRSSWPGWTLPPPASPPPAHRGFGRAAVRCGSSSGAGVGGSAGWPPNCFSTSSCPPSPSTAARSAALKVDRSCSMQLRAAGPRWSGVDGRPAPPSGPRSSSPRWRCLLHRASFLCRHQPLQRSPPAASPVLGLREERTVVYPQPLYRLQGELAGHGGMAPCHLCRPGRNA